MNLTKDVRSLGLGAVPRGLYEMSKWTGAHRLLFRSVTSASTLRPSGERLIARPGSVAAQTCLQDAALIIDEGLLAFGRRIPFRTSSDWNTDPETGRIWPQVPWWRIDIRSERRLADVKWVWELGRHRDLVVLARAAAIEPDQPKWSIHLDRLMKWWCDASPPESSIHWYSNLEIALRILAWDQVLGLAGRQLSKSTRDSMSLHATQMRRHLWRDLPYTLSSMRNNHMLGDALGIGVAELLTDQPRSRIRSAMTQLIWRSQLARQVNLDGSMIEDSVSYHRFVLEMLSARYLMGDHSPELIGAISRSSYYLADLGALEGPIPQYGDWDEGRVLTSSGDSLDLGNSTALGLAIAGEPEGKDWRDRFDLLDWYLPRRVGSSLSGRQSSFQTSRTVGNIAIGRRGEWLVWMKSGSGPSHGHADLGHLSVRYRDRWLLVDPGTGTYNGPLEVRNGFRISHAHNVLRPLGRSQIEPHRAFRWMSIPTGRTGRIIETASATVMWGAHDAYVMQEASPWPWRIARTVVLTARGLAVIDWRECDDQSAFELSVPFSRSCKLSEKLVEVGGENLALRIPGVARVALGEHEPFLGWESPTYGRWLRAPWIVAAGDQVGPIPWTLGDIDLVAASDAVTVEQIGLSVVWEEDCVRLSVAASSHSMQDSIRLGRTQ